MAKCRCCYLDFGRSGKIAENTVRRSRNQKRFILAIHRFKDGRRLKTQRPHSRRRSLVPLVVEAVVPTACRQALGTRASTIKSLCLSLSLSKPLSLRCPAWLRNLRRKTRFHRIIVQILGTHDEESLTIKSPCHCFPLCPPCPLWLNHWILPAAGLEPARPSRDKGF